MSTTPSWRRPSRRTAPPIGYWRSGQGPALVLVHGTTADASRWETVLPLLEPHVTVYAMDRRGRGASGDARRLRARARGRRRRRGGGRRRRRHRRPGRRASVTPTARICALEAAAAAPTAMRRLVLYEPAARAVTPAGFADRMAELLAQGRREEVVIALLRELAGLSADQLELAMVAPSWPGRVAAAHTVVRETRAEDRYRFEPDRFAALTGADAAAGRLGQPAGARRESTAGSPPRYPARASSRWRVRGTSRCSPPRPVRRRGLAFLRDGGR